MTLQVPPMAPLTADKISDEELDSFTTAVKARFGIDFTNYERKSLKRGIVRLISKQKLGNMVELWTAFLRNREMLVLYIDELLVNLTELFRNPEAWQKIKYHVMPQFASRPSLHIWHAGCSTGEEIYSMTILLQQLNLLEVTRLTATDLSEKALAEARQATYPKILWERYKNLLLSYDPLLGIRLDQFFEVDKKSFSILPALTQNINWQKHNLVQDEHYTDCDLVFCRNVMIYFDEALKMRVLRKFHAALRPGGFLIIGYYDMLPEESKMLFKPYDLNTKIYQKI